MAQRVAAGLSTAAGTARTLLARDLGDYVALAVRLAAGAAAATDSAGAPVPPLREVAARLRAGRDGGGGGVEGDGGGLAVFDTGRQVGERQTETETRRDRDRDGIAAKLSRFSLDSEMQHGRSGTGKQAWLWPAKWTSPLAPPTI
jgi:hypothetical protein